MRIPVKCDNKGFSLVEFLVAVLILTIGLFALLTTVDVAIKHNMAGKFRNDAVVLAEQYLANIRSIPYANLVTSAPVIVNVQSGASTKPYTVITTVTPVPLTNSSRVLIEVRWLERGDTGVANGQVFHAHTISTLVTNTIP